MASNPDMIDHSLHIHPRTTLARKACEEAAKGLLIGSQVEVRFTGEDGRMRSWMLTCELPGVGGANVAVTGIMLGATFPAMIDGQLENQRNSIDRMLGHLKHDCPDFNGGMCEFAFKQRNGEE